MTIEQDGKVPDWVSDGSAEEHMKGIDQRVQELAEEEGETIDMWCFECHKTTSHIIKEEYDKKASRQYTYQVCCICDSPSHLI